MITHKEELAAISTKLDTLLTQLAYVSERQRQQEELIAELMPIGKAALGTTIERLDAFEKQGYFEFGKEMLAIGKKIVDGFSTDDVRQLGEAVVPILDAVRAMTQPRVLAIANDASSVFDDQEAVKPLGVFGMVRASHDDDVRKGMGIMIEVLRRIGHGANAMSAQHAQLEDKKAKLARTLGPRKRKKALGIERRLPASTTPKLNTAPAPAVPATTTIDGIEYTADGYVANAEAWTPPLGEALAHLQGVTLNTDHWKLIDAARSDYADTGLSPNIHRLTQIAGVTTKDVYALFPKAPGRTIAKIAGLPKPVGCI